MIVNLTDAIEMGSVALPTLVKRLEAAEKRRQELVAAATVAEELGPLPRVDWRHVERLAREKLDGWRTLLTRQIQEGRQWLRELLEVPIQFTPFEEDGRRGYRFHGLLSIGRLLSGVVVIGMASPPGFEPGFQP